MPPVRNRGRASTSSVPVRESPARIAKTSKKGASKDTSPCTICFEELNTKRTMKMDCSHKFHRTCLIGWLETRKRADDQACPNCREPARFRKIGKEKFDLREVFGKFQQPTLWFMYLTAQELRTTMGERRRFRHIKPKEAVVEAHDMLEKKTAVDIKLVQKHLKEAKTAVAEKEYVEDIEEEMEKLRERSRIYEEMRTLKAITEEDQLPYPSGRVKWDLDAEKMRLSTKEEENPPSEDDDDSSSGDSELWMTDDEDEENSRPPIQSTIRYRRAARPLSANRTAPPVDDAAADAQDTPPPTRRYRVYSGPAPTLVPEYEPLRNGARRGGGQAARSSRARVPEVTNSTVRPNESALPAAIQPTGRGGMETLRGTPLAAVIAINRGAATTQSRGLPVTTPSAQGPSASAGRGHRGIATRTVTTVTTSSKIVNAPPCPLHVPTSSNQNGSTRGGVAPAASTACPAITCVVQPVAAETDAPATNGRTETRKRAAADEGGIATRSRSTRQ